MYTRVTSDVYFVCQCSNFFITCSFLSYYLKAVCYLNNHGEDYKGGILQFQDGDPSSIVPVAGVSKSFLLCIRVVSEYFSYEAHIFVD